MQAIHLTKSFQSSFWTSLDVDLNSSLLYFTPKIYSGHLVNTRAVIRGWVMLKYVNNNIYSSIIIRLI
jgi:hypothetical protein